MSGQSATRYPRAGTFGTLLEHWDGHALIKRYRSGRWDVVDPGQVGSDFTNLWGVAVSGDKIWAVGTYKDGGPRNTLIMRHSES